MERESFENEDIARLMNEAFVCIKVDREERPDLDNVYMKAVQMMTGHGGWPMTVFLTPELRPFYAGTYFPPVDRGGMPGFPRVLEALARAFREEPDKVAERGAHVVELLQGEPQASQVAAAELSDAGLRETAEALARAMDAEYGGFGRAPKFPASLALSFLMGRESGAARTNTTDLVRTTLDRMGDGGIYDHLGGGFHRYSVDRYWLVPHFEKMLYDQALLADTYGEAWLLFDEPRYAETARGILDYVAREMTSAEGAFFSTQDADSEGEEGKFYVWTPDEIRRVVGAADAELVCRFFDVSDAGNFEGHNILHRTISIDDTARMFETTPDHVRTVLEQATAALYEQRKTRVAPATDTKVLADWNGLMIGAMASVGRRLARPDLVARAASAGDFVRSRMMKDGRLLHFFAEGAARVDGFLDDYAFFGRGCLEVFAALGRREDLATAIACADALVARFVAPNGGFYFSALDAEPLVARSRDLFDGAVPSGNSVATELLLRLYDLTANDDYRRVGEEALRGFLGSALSNPYGCAHLLTIAERHAKHYTSVAIAGGHGDVNGARELENVALRVHAPGVTVFVLPDEAPGWAPEALKGKVAIDGHSAAYVCRGQTCSAPVTKAEDLAALLRPEA
jgi:uncharacterized protein YyaL (SSP411 family)